MDRKSMRFGNVIQNADFDKNIRLEKLILKLEKVLSSNGFQKCRVPAVDYYNRYISGNNMEEVQDLYKVVAGDGQMLAMPNDSVIALLNSLVLKRNETSRYFSVMETYSFLKANNPQNGYEIAIAITATNGYEAEAEMCGLALDLASALGINDPLRLSNTEIVQGIVDYYSKRAESKDKAHKIISGIIESESDFAAGQALSELKKIKEETAKEHIKELSKKIDNQRSLDGAVDVYEVITLLEAQGKEGKAVVEPLYIGQERSQNGFVFYIGDEVPIFYGGRMVYVSGQESMNVIMLKIDLAQLALIINTLPKEPASRVGLLVGDSAVAYSRALKFKADFLKNGLISEIQYKVKAEEAEKIMAERDSKEYLVLFVADDGTVRHN